MGAASKCKHGARVDRAQLPQEDDVYKVLQQANTVGMFQVESRAQMASLPRNKPDHFYDIAVQVAIIRPGPIARQRPGTASGFIFLSMEDET